MPDISPATPPDQAPPAERFSGPVVQADHLSVRYGKNMALNDVTAVFPWLTHALLSEPKNKRKPMRLMDKMQEAIGFLDADVKKRHKALMKTLDWSIEEAEPSKEDDAKDHEAYVR